MQIQKFQIQSYYVNVYEKKKVQRFLFLRDPLYAFVEEKIRHRVSSKRALKFVELQ